jgi:predicted metal-dependent hydrolase
MRFLVRIANRSHVTPAETKQLSKLAYEAVKTYGADVGNLRVSSSAVEFDLLINSDDKLQTVLKALEPRIGPLLTLRKLDVMVPPIENTEAIKLGIDLFNEERYWESHEALEAAWKKSTGDQKEVLQGLILIAAAFVHSQKNEELVALSVMRRAREKLTSHRKEYFGIDIADLTEKLDKMLAASKPEFFRLIIGNDDLQAAKS